MVSVQGGFCNLKIDPDILLAFAMHQNDHNTSICSFDFQFDPNRMPLQLPPAEILC